MSEIEKLRNEDDLWRMLEKAAADKEAADAADANQSALRELAHDQFDSRLGSADSVDEVVDEFEEQLQRAAAQQKEEDPETERDVVIAKESGRKLSWIDSFPLRKFALVASIVTILCGTLTGIAITISTSYDNHIPGRQFVQGKQRTTPDPDQIHFRVDYEEGNDFAEVIISLPEGVSEVLIYENTRVMRSWRRPAKFQRNMSIRTDYHRSGTYIYFAEIYFGGEKVATHQCQVIFNVSKNNKSR